MIDILKKAALAAGKIQLQYFGKDIAVSYKTNKQNLLTKVDLESQKIIQETITKEMLKKGYEKKSIGFIGEEKLYIKGKHLFAIDPIDGTTNFACGLKHFGVSIAHFVENKLVDGLIYIPIINTTYFASKSKGAYKEKQKLAVIYKNLDECFASTYLSSVGKDREKSIKTILKLIPNIRGLRLLGCYVVESGLTAENVFQIRFGHRAGIWDISAAKIILEESGASFTDFKGKPISFDLSSPDKNYQTLACHPKLLNEILKYFD